MPSIPSRSSTNDVGVGLHVKLLYGRMTCFSTLIAQILGIHGWINNYNDIQQFDLIGSSSFMDERPHVRNHLESLTTGSVTWKEINELREDKRGTRELKENYRKRAHI